MIADFDSIIFDMNATFMFGHDRFDNPDQFGAYFKKIGGSLSAQHASNIIVRVYDYLAQRYPDPDYRECFPSLRTALDVVVDGELVIEKDLDLLVETFAHFECGAVPPEFATALLKLASTHKLGLVADIWAPKNSWLVEFDRAGITPAFQAMSFSSDCGIVKPSPEPFKRVLKSLNAEPSRTLVIGDSVNRDLAGAVAAGLSCILVGRAQNALALHSVESLLCVL